MEWIQDRERGGIFLFLPAILIAPLSFLQLLWIWESGKDDEISLLVASENLGIRDHVHMTSARRGGGGVQELPNREVENSFSSKIQSTESQRVQSN